MSRRKVIHIHRQRMAQGKPAVIVRQGGRSRYYSTVRIDGPSVVVHDPSRSRQPKAWIETDSEVHGR